jgi:predicted NAD/FAD-binding protein
MAPSGKDLNVAVVGGGVAGITAAYQLQKAHSVTLLEANDYVGGHTNTLVIPDGPDAGTPVDTGFIVLNDRTYPTLNRFFKSLNVAIRKSDMSFSYFSERTGFQYASRNFNSLFAQRKNLFNPFHWKMLGEIMRFNRRVQQGLQDGDIGDITLGQFLRQHRYSRRFQRHYVYPMVAAIWSAPDARVDEFPMLTFARFFHNHGLLSVSDQPQWYYVAGGSQTYVRAFLKQFSGRVETNADVTAIERTAAGVILKDSKGNTRPFDRVVIATHADQALNLLADPSDEEKSLLGPWTYSVNETFLHTDTRWMPANRRAWASWNFIREADAGADAPVTLTYHMNRLQELNTRNEYLVTLNPFKPIDAEKIIAHMTYTHPTYTFASLDTQRYLPRLNGLGNTAFCGSYFGYGFHEDAARAGIQAAAALGVPDEL